ncbi:hypothetical protein [Leptobacterium sp. I13]
MKNTIAAILLVIIGIVMVYISVKAKILPPGLTGLGFFVIAYTLIGKSKQ